MLTCTVPVHHPVLARYTRYVSIFVKCILYASFFLSSLLNIRIWHRWAKIESETKLSLGRGRSPKRIGANIRPNRGMANIAGFVPLTSCAWSNTGAHCEPPKYSRLEPRPPRRLLVGDRRGAK
jgi:hypothetical protein